MKKTIGILLLAILLMACVSQNNTNNDDSAVSYSREDRATAAQINVELGLGYLQQRQVPRAKQKLLLALQQNPKSITVLDAMAYFWEVTGNNALANKYFKQAIILDPNSGQGLNNYGTYLCRIGKYNLGEKYLLTAANELTYINSAAAMENAGLCELGIPNINQAEKYFKKAIQQDPNRAASYYELAQINYNQGDYNLARQYLKGYELIGPRSAASLWLAILLAEKTKDVATILKNGALLKKYFVNSPQYQLYQKTQLS